MLIGIDLKVSFKGLKAVMIFKKLQIHWHFSFKHKKYTLGLEKINLKNLIFWINLLLRMLLSEWWVITYNKFLDGFIWYTLYFPFQIHLPFQQRIWCQCYHRWNLSSQFWSLQRRIESGLHHISKTADLKCAVPLTVTTNYESLQEKLKVTFYKGTEWG